MTDQCHSSKFNGHSSKFNEKKEEKVFCVRLVFVFSLQATYQLPSLVLNKGNCPRCHVTLCSSIAKYDFHGTYIFFLKK